MQDRGTGCGENNPRHTRHNPGPPAVTAEQAAGDTASFKALCLQRNC